MKEGLGRRQDPGRQGGERAPCQDMLSSGPPSPVAGPLLVSLFLLHFDSGDEVAGTMLSAAGRAECAESQWSCSVSSALFLSICPSGHPPIQSSTHLCPSTHSAHTSWVDSMPYPVYGTAQGKVHKVGEMGSWPICELCDLGQVHNHSEPLLTCL